MPINIVNPIPHYYLLYFYLQKQELYNSSLSLSLAYSDYQDIIARRVEVIIIFVLNKRLSLQVDCVLKFLIQFRLI